VLISSDWKWVWISSTQSPTTKASNHKF